MPYAAHAPDRYIHPSGGKSRTTEVERVRRGLASYAAARHEWLEKLSRLPPAGLTENRGASFPPLLDFLGPSLGRSDPWTLRVSPLAGEPFPPCDPPEPRTRDDL